MKGPQATWREVLVDAQEGLDAAEKHRTAMIRAAHNAGLSLRQIGGVLGMSAAGVHRVTGKRLEVTPDSDVEPEEPIFRLKGL